MKLNAAQIAEIIQGSVIGDPNVEVASVAKIEEATPNDLCFISNAKYGHYLNTTEAGVVLVNDKIKDIPEHKTVIRCADPYVAFCQILIQFYDYKHPHSGIDPTAVIDESAIIGEGCYIGPHVYIGKDVTIGKGCKIFANSTVYEASHIGDHTVIHSNVSIYHHTIIGSECLIHAGTVIGSDGFGHAPLPNGTYVKIPQIGNVILGDRVELGSNCSIDRANMGSTVIKDGCKLDNLIQVAHGVEIGEHTVIAAQVAIAGSTKIGKHCVIGGQAGVGGHIVVADYTQIGAQSGITNNIREAGGKYVDNPFMPLPHALRTRAVYKNLPAMEKRIQELENTIKKLNDSNG